jgi:hypothetical protein
LGSLEAGTFRNTTPQRFGTVLDEFPSTQIGIALFGAAVTGYGVRLRARAAETLRWPAVRGRIVRCLVREDTPLIRGADEPRAMYRPEVRYEYVVDGREHAATRIDLLDRAASSPEFAERVIARYPMWSEVTVFYDPTDPRRAILERESTPEWAFWIVVAGLAVTLGAIASAYVVVMGL